MSTKFVALTTPDCKKICIGSSYERTVFKARLLSREDFHVEEYGFDKNKESYLRRIWDSDGNVVVGKPTKKRI